METDAILKRPDVSEQESLAREFGELFEKTFRLERELETVLER